MKKVLFLAMFCFLAIQLPAKEKKLRTHRMKVTAPAPGTWVDNWYQYYQAKAARKKAG